MSELFTYGEVGGVGGNPGSYPDCENCCKGTLTCVRPGKLNSKLSEEVTVYFVLIVLKIVQGLSNRTSVR